MQKRIRPVKIKDTHIIYFIFIVICFIAFAFFDQNPSSENRRQSDLILFMLIAIFAIFITYYDFRKKLSFFNIFPTLFVLCIINIILFTLIFFTKISLSIGFLLPLFMIEGAITYIILEKKVSSINDK